MNGQKRFEDRVLVFAPRGRDAAVVEQVLGRRGFETLLCGGIADCLTGLDGGAATALVTEEALADVDLDPVFAWLDAQPPWSDFPIVLMAIHQAGRRSERAAYVLERLGNVILLERPVNAQTLASAVASALRARRRQYQAREHLLDRERSRDLLRQINENLERRIAERTHEVEAARETLSFALDSAEMASWDLDLIHDHARCSPRFDSIFGYAEAPPPWGRETFLEHVIDEDRDAVRAAFAAALKTLVLNTECQIRRRDGAVRWIAFKGRVGSVDGQAASRMAGVILDRTEQRVIEDTLRQAQKMEAIGQLTGGVAHDFNNLLTVIVGGLDMMIRKPDNVARVKRLAEAAMTAAQRGEQLTQQLLAFSRRQMLRPRTLNCNRLLMDFKSLAERAAGSAIELRFDLDPDLDPIRIDPAQFEAAVLNLIVNARDAMDAGARGARIDITSRNIMLDSVAFTGEALMPGAYVVIAVRDTGCGMDQETKTRVFEPFFTTKDVGKGTGLGLAQVYGFARAADGHASIDTTVGGGTTVTLYFPRSCDPAVDEERLAPTGSMPLRRATDGDTVLLVEDDEQVLEMAVESLEELRYKVVVARNAAEALACIESGERVDILFSDVVMPGGMSGAQLAAEARRLRPDLKVLLTSGYVADRDEQQSLGRSQLQVLNKPYRRDELAQTLRTVLAEGA